MRNPEMLVQFQRQDLIAEQEECPIEGKSFENLRRFLAYSAIAPVRIYPPNEKPNYSDKSIYYPLPGEFTNLQDLKRNVRIVWDYAFKEDTLEEIGKREDNLTKQAAWQIIKRTVKGLYNGADEEARARFPFESFDFKKPRTLASRQKSSEKRGGISLEIARRLEQGATLDELKKDFTRDQIASARLILESWGYKLDRKLTPILPQFEGLRNLDATDSEIQTLLDKISRHDQYQVLKQAGLVINLSTVARKAGLYIMSEQVDFISESLAKEKLPQTKVPHKTKDKNGQERIGYYHIIAASHEPNAIDILNNDRSLDDLRTNPVRQIAGPRARITPNTTKLVSQEYGHIGNLIAEIRGFRWSGRGKGGIKTSDIIKGSPLGIYINHQGNIYYRKDQEGDLRNYLESRLRELGMIQT